MITNKEESLVLNELEELYLSHGEASLNYTLTTRYEDLKQIVINSFRFTVSSVIKTHWVDYVIKWTS